MDLGRESGTRKNGVGKVLGSPKGTFLKEQCHKIEPYCLILNKNSFHNVSNDWKIPWFFQVDFFKFHDFSRFLGLFPNSMIFPGLEKVIFILQFSINFPEAGNPVYAIVILYSNTSRLWMPFIIWYQSIWITLIHLSIDC